MLHEFYLQATSQVDGLRHRRASGYGFYNGVADDDIRAGTPALGVQRWAEKPIVGRGLVVDIEGLLAAEGTPLDHRAGPALDVDLLDRALHAQGEQVRPGDLVLVHTGWTRWFLDADAGAAGRGPRRAPGHRVPAEPRAPGVAVGPPGRAVRHRHLRRRGPSRGARQPVSSTPRRRTPG